MRPSHLEPLFRNLIELEGVGPKLIKLFAKLLGKSAEGENLHIGDVLWHMPTGLIDRRARLKINQLVARQIATLDATVLSHKAPANRHQRTPYRVRVEDETGQIDLVFFRADKKYLQQQLPVGEKRIISGRIEEYAGKKQMSHPDYMLKTARD